MTLSKRALLAVFLVGAPIIMIFIHDYRASKQFLIDEVEQNYLLVADIYEGQIRNFLQGANKRTEDFASDGLIKTQLRKISSEKTASAAETLKTHLIENKLPLDESIVGIFLLSQEGRVIASTHSELIDRDFSGGDLFIKSGEGSNAFEFRVAEKQTLAVSSVIRDSRTKELLGVLVNLFDISGVNVLFSGRPPWNHGVNMLLVGRDRTVLHETGRPATRDKIHTPPVDACLNKGENISAAYLDSKGRKVLGVSRCIPSLGWTLAIEAQEGILLSSSMSMLRNAAIAGLLTMIILTAFYLMFIRRITNAINRILSAASELRLGNYAIRLASTAKDEFGLICAAFDSMAHEIGKRSRLLEESESKYRLLHDTAFDGIILADESGEIIDANPSTGQMFGYRREDLIGCRLTELMPEGLRKRHLASVEEFFKRKIMKNRGKILETEGLRRNGDVFPIELVVSSFDVNGKTYITGTIRDLSALRRSEDALSLTSKKYRELFEEIKDVVLTCKFDGTIIDINPVGVELFKYATKEELLKADLEKDICCSKEEFLNFKQEILEKGIVDNYEISMRTKEGDQHIMLASAAVVRDEHGRALGCRGILRDITGYKRLEEQLLHSRKLRAVGELAGGIAHDFNNILTAIIGYTNTLALKMRKDDPSQVYVENVMTLSERAANLTQGLLSFSRKRVFDFKPIEINSLISELKKFLSRLINETIELSSSLSKEPITVFADKTQIELVLMNLVTNATDAMPQGGTLLVATEKKRLEGKLRTRSGDMEPGEYACITVKDTGTGLTEKVREQIFEPFFTTKEVGKGTGLGLSIVYGIIKEHKGFIEVESEPGKGAAFNIYVPLHRETEDLAFGINRPPLLRLTEGTETILLAEDEKDVRWLIRNCLEEHGYKVVEAKDGQEAVKKFMENPDAIDILVLDLVMPGKNGKSAYDDIVKNKPGIKAVFMSGYQGGVLGKHDFPKEDAVFMSKPLAPLDIVRKIRELLDYERYR